ncbi:hypothetical protein PH235_13055 [Trichococcus sp. K1Tr]|jgi:hypothetical protein|uniref:hypothetical protein n=1 Tax=Trichococcus sp. K1Tr TaxID=3020847 RepID=UPI00232CF1B5|nr:hypothetical protein [Trichococcus sp. K1Tr]MDB6354486.1 hypothetical protein [Trichococcus sp. K1Tr]
MKKPIVTTLFFLSSMMVLSGCGGSISTTSVVESIENAAQKNAELDNARFETRYSMDSDAEPFDQSSEGVFVKTAESDYDWYQKTSFDGTNATEAAQIDGKQYQKISVPGQAETQWVGVYSTGFALQDLLRSLFENEIVEADIAESQVEDEGISEEYTLTMSDAYAERIKEENVEAIQQNSDELKQNDEEALVIEEIETRLQEIKETNYQDVIITYEINEEGFLTAAHYESTVVPPTGEPYTVVTSFSLTEYNLDDTGDLLPQIAE